jgi:hypothetical protein
MTVRIAILKFKGNKFFLPDEIGKICVANELEYAYIGDIKDSEGKDRCVYDIYDLDSEQDIILKIHFPKINIIQKD